MHYKKEKRSEIDLCNICGKKNKLTWDHVPPKSCNNRFDIITNSWERGIPKENNYEKKYQSGIRFRSLCDECNNKLLGANYDKELEVFTNTIMQIAMSNIVLPEVIKISVKINKLCRAICGHLLAAKNYYDDECMIDKKLREYFLHEELLPPEEMSLLYWYYPYSTICIMRDVVVNSSNNMYAFPEGTVSIVNSYPIAYMLSSNKEGQCGLPDLFDFCNDDIEYRLEIPIEFSNSCFRGTSHFRPFLWPCNISDEADGTAFVLAYDKNMNSSTIAKHSEEAIEKIKKKRK